MYDELEQHFRDKHREDFKKSFAVAMKEPKSVAAYETVKEDAAYRDGFKDGKNSMRVAIDVAAAKALGGSLTC